MVIISNLLLLAVVALPVNKALTPPEPRREFRAAWVATVDNIDWPSKRGLPVEQQQSEIIVILNRAVQLNLNAIVLQVRPSCDCLYASTLEPWSEYLTGQMGQPPQPFYDPLEFWINQAHSRGIELHAWFNPYRAHHPSAKGPISANHISRTKPDIVRKYGSLLWMDPGDLDVQNHTMKVILDVVKRYDVDGVHIDDYFYPYKEKDSSGHEIAFPDDISFRRFASRGGGLSRDDWRRENVNRFVERLYKDVKKTKNYVKVGISPFGIWRPGYPSQIKGLDQYTELYADARKWLQQGWCDYFSPQLYWPISQAAQSYPVLLDWWLQQNDKGRHIWPGNYTSRVADGSKTAWKAQEVADQIAITRSHEGAGGNVHFSMKSLMQDSNGLAATLSKSAYHDQALVPATPWLTSKQIRAPKTTLDGDRLAWKNSKGSTAWQWLVRWQSGSTWKTRILPGGIFEIQLSDNPGRYVVNAVDRLGVLGEPFDSSQ